VPEAGLVSVVIPTVGRISITEVLGGLAAQRDPGEFEVIVVVDGGKAAGVSGAAVHPQCRRLVLIELPERRGVAVVRNRGVAEARGEYLGFLDDDTIPAADWIAEARRVLSGGHVAAALGRIREASPTALGRLRAAAYDFRHVENLSEAMTAVVAERYGLDRDCDCRLVGYLSGGNCCMLAAVFRECQGFDQTFAVGQDRELGERLLRSRYHVSYEPNLEIEHRTVATIAGLVRGRYASGKSAARLQVPVPASALALARQSYGASPLQLAVRLGPMAGALAWLSAIAYRKGARSATGHKTAAYQKTRSSP
jgi:GT2 family glycosyltransferase